MKTAPFGAVAALTGFAAVTHYVSRWEAAGLICYRALPGTHSVGLPVAEPLTRRVRSVVNRNEETSILHDE